MLGQVYKAHSNKYFVKVNNKVIQCNARGLLKLKGDAICVGDYVEVEKDVIVSVEKRKNNFIRPNVSNVDTIVAVFSPEPKPDFYLLDKLLLNSVKEDVEFIILINKSDVDATLFDSIKKEYEPLGVLVESVCAKTKEGIEKLKKLLRGKLSVFAGQSAAGKTSLVNALFDLNLKVGELSVKTERGKHTTTRSEIFEVEDIKVIDSPGFAVIDADVTLKELPDCYPEYLSVANQCKFRGCSHVNEPECMVKKLVEDGVFSKNRYQRYVEIYDEISKRRTLYEKN